MLDALGYHRGLHLRGTPLWFDAEQPKEFSIQTALIARRPPPHRRAFASCELAQALMRLGHQGSLLPLPWSRSVGVGGQRIELIDVHCRPGAAAVFLHHEAGRLLILGLLRQAPAALPRTDCLVAHVPALLHQGHDITAVVTRLQDFFAGHVSPREQRAAVVVETVEVGLALMPLLELAGFKVKPTGLLAKIAALPASCRQPEPTLRSLAGPSRDQQPLYIGLAIAGAWGATRVAWVDCGLGACRDLAASGTGTAAICLPLAWYANLGTVQATLESTGARSAALLGVPLEAQTTIARAINPGCAVRFLSSAEQLNLKAHLPEAQCGQCHVAPT